MALQKEMTRKGGEGRDLSLNMLSEGCIAEVLSFTSPRDACRLSAVSLLFKSAADSDVVWKRFIPHDYQSIISLSDSSVQLGFISLSKKELYLNLCDKPFLIENGEKSFSLHKRSGKKYFMLSSRSLQIALSGYRLHWRWDPDPKSRFAQAAHLIRVRRLEILGGINTRMLSPATWYTTYLVFKFITVEYGCSKQRRYYSIACGFDGHSVKVSVGLVGGETSSRIVFWNLENHRNIRRCIASSSPTNGRHYPLENQRNIRRCISSSAPTNDRHYPKDRGDGWLEIELGEFFNKEGEDGELEMRVVDNNNDDVKGGLIVEGIEIRPKEVN